MLNKMIKETEAIELYSYDNDSNSFLVQSHTSTVQVFQDLVSLVNILSKLKIQFSVDAEHNVKINIIKIHPQTAFVVSLDDHARITEINDYALKMTGYTKEELLHKSFFDIFIADEDKESLNQVFESVMAGKHNHWKYQNNITLKDGSQKYLYWSNTVIKDENNKINSLHTYGVLQ